MEQTGRPMTLWRGNCYAHVEFRRDQLLKLRRAFSNPATLRQRLYFLRSIRSASNNKGFGLPCESGGFLITMVNKEFSIVLLIGLILLFVYLFLLGKYGDKTLIGLIFVSGVITFLLYASDDVQRFAAKGFGTEVSIEKLQTVRNEVFASAQQVQTLAESTAVTVSTILSNFDYFAPKEGVESRPWTEDSEARRKGIEIHNNLKELLKSSDPKIANQALLPLERAIVKGIGISLRGPIFYAVYEVKTGHKAGVGPYPDIATQDQIHAVSDQAMQLALDSRIGDASNELETFLKSQHIWTPEIQKAIQTFEDERRLLH